MKRTIPSAVALLVLFALAPGAHAGGAACSLARAAGTYGISGTGTILGIGPAAFVTLATFDSGGAIRGKSTLNENGAISHRTLSGTYTVNHDCTGTTTFDEFDQSGSLVITLTADLVWEDGMSHLRFIVTSVVVPDGPSIPIVLSGDGKKLVP